MVDSTQQRKKTKPKLKDSCNECAAAKLRCSKDKPTCARCEDRDLVCCYGPSSRAGRKSASSVASAERQAINARAGGQATEAPQSALPECQERVEPLNIPYQQQPAFSWDSFKIPDYGMHGAGPSLSSHPSLGDEFHLDPTSPKFDMASIMPGIQGFPSQGNSLNTFNDWSTPDLMFSPLFSGMPSPPSSHCTQPTPPSSTATPPLPPLVSTSSCESVTESISSCTTGDSHCMNTACSILASLHNESHHGSPTTENDYTGFDYSSFLNLTDDSITTARVALDKASMMLQCPCSAENEHLTFLLSMITSKTMAVFAQAAYDSAKSGHLDASVFGSKSNLPMSSTAGNMSLDSSNSSRAKAQLLLGELHQVVRVIDTLSTRFQDLKRTGSVANGGLHGNNLCQSGSTSPVMSPSTFDQMEADLRKRLRAITDHVVGSLRGL